MRYPQYYTEISRGEAIKFIVGYDRDFETKEITIKSVELIECFGLNIIELVKEKTLIEIYNAVKDSKNNLMGDE